MTNVVVPVDKPVGPTSHDVVSAARRAFGERRIGHTGTLDPFASGLLLICVGKATRLAEYLTDLPKSYEAVARLGITTATEDLEGEVLEERGGWEALGEPEIGAGMEALRGDILQVPPQFSAKKVEGVRMHERARRGERVELEARPVTVHEIELLDVDLPFVRFFTRCSSGTYVRSLARDLGEALGVGAHLTELRRTAIGGFGVDAAVTVADLDDPAAVRAAAIEPVSALGHLPSISVGSDAVGRLAHGQWVDAAVSDEAGPVAVASDGVLVAVGEVRSGKLRPRKVFVS